MKALEPHMMRLMFLGAVCLCLGLLLLLLASGGWVQDGGPLRHIVLIGALLLNLAGTWFFLRYLIAYLKDLLSKR